MRILYSELRCLEVINICDGARLGFVDDLEMDTETGRVLALVIPGPAKFLGLAGREEDYIIPIECVRRIGEDIILVEEEPSRACVPRPGRKKERHQSGKR